MRAPEFCQLLKKEGFNFYVGVPCSLLRSIIDCLLDDPEVRCLIATREEEAIGIAAGVSLGGGKPLVFMQNSGLANALGALSSLSMIYKIPMLLLVSWRGFKGLDAPEHMIIGKITLSLLENVGIPAFTPEPGEVAEATEKAIKKMEESQRPVALVLRKGVIS